MNPEHYRLTAAALEAEQPAPRSPIDELHYQIDRLRNTLGQDQIETLWKCEDAVRTELATVNALLANFIPADSKPI